LKNICDFDSDPVMETLLYYLNVEVTRLLAAIIGNIKQKPKSRRWNFRGKVLTLPLLNVTLCPMSFPGQYSSSHPDASCSSS